MDKAELMGSVAVKSSAIFGLLHRPEAAKPIGTRAKPVAIVVEQGILGNQPAGG